MSVFKIIFKNLQNKLADVIDSAANYTIFKDAVRNMAYCAIFSIRTINDYDAIVKCRMNLENIGNPRLLDLVPSENEICKFIIQSPIGQNIKKHAIERLMINIVSSLYSRKKRAREIGIMEARDFIYSLGLYEDILYVLKSIGSVNSAYLRIKELKPLYQIVSGKCIEFINYAKDDAKMLKEYLKITQRVLDPTINKFDLQRFTILIEAHIAVNENLKLPKGNVEKDKPKKDVFKEPFIIDMPMPEYQEKDPMEDLLEIEMM